LILFNFVGIEGGVQVEKIKLCWYRRRLILVATEEKNEGKAKVKRTKRKARVVIKGKSE
jgi:hypothetical protein